MAFFDLDALKDDLGITGSDHDAWLARRTAGAIARMSQYTHRYIGPVAEFVDEWRPPNNEISARVYWPTRGSAIFYLRHFPVVAIESTLDDGNAISGTIFEAASGKLIGYGNVASPNGFNMPTVTYHAGWVELPPDLYDVMVGVLLPQWQARANAAAGLVGAGSVSIADVGDIDFAGALSGTAFERAASGQVVDPILGPYAGILDGYTDKRASLGSIMMPRTTFVALVPETP